MSITPIQKEVILEIELNVKQQNLDKILSLIKYIPEDILRQWVNYDQDGFQPILTVVSNED